MPKLVKVTESQIFSRREFWKLENGFEVIVSETDDSCVLFVSGNKNGKSVDLVSAYLDAQGIKHSLGETIDSKCIELPKPEKLEALKVIEQWAW